MTKASTIQTSFNAGEVTPLVYGRPDLQKYGNGLETCQNMIPMVQGPLTSRPGTVFVNEVKDSSVYTRALEFVFSTTQAYIIEAGNLYFRFYRNRAQIVSGTPVEMATPYPTNVLSGLKTTQSADVLYIFHPSYAPRKLSRTSDTVWSLSTMATTDGPYLNTNTTTTTLTASGTTGSVTLTASATTGINNGQGFLATDVGRVVRLLVSSVWGWGTITARTSTTQVTVQVGSAFGATTATAVWRLGVYSDTTGWPSCGTFFEDRLFMGGSTSNPQRLDGSMSGDYENFAPTSTTGVVAANNALGFTLNSNDVNTIRWMADDEKGLLVGTVGGEWIVRPSSSGEALSATNISAKRSTSYGSADVQPVRAGRAILFIQKSRRKLRELAYQFDVDGFRAPDMTQLSEHITLPGIQEMTYQQEPQSLVWVCRDDGVLIGATYDRDQDVVAWHRHIIGGSGFVESVGAIPRPDGSGDELYVIVRRTINGATKRYVEYMNKLWERGDTQAAAVFADSAKTYTTPGSTVTGLDHLEGQTVSVLVDGAVHPDKIVTGGQITLDFTGTTVVVGLPYVRRGKTLRINAGAADGTAQGKTKRIHRLVFRLHDSLGLTKGPNFNQLDEVVFRSSTDPMGAAVPLFSGDKSDTWGGDYDLEGQVCWEITQPVPCTILDVMPVVVTQDR
jgi:hypothetical protein